jgi:hypothetical protein
MLRILVMSLLAAAAVNALGDEPGVADGWRFASSRPEVAPKNSIRNGGLVITGNGSSIADGKWSKRFDLPDGKFITLTGQLRASNI